MLDEPNLESFEPKDYFEELKTKLNKNEIASLERQLSKVGEQLIKAEELGTKNVVHKLSFLFKTIMKEQTLLLKGYNQFVYLDDIAKFIDKVEPLNSVKIVELNRYPRLIPDAPAKNLKEVSDLKIFDEIVVVYTDYTNEKVETKADQEMVKRNRDPIAFGIFYNAAMNFKHDRAYFIADWEDEFCDLTFSKMIEKMADMEIRHEAETIQPVNFESLNAIVENALTEMSQTNRSNFASNAPIALDTLEEKTKEGIKEKILKFIGKLKNESRK